MTKNELEFLRGLNKLSKKTGLCISGPGWIDSMPFLMSTDGGTGYHFSQTEDGIVEIDWSTHPVDLDLIQLSGLK